MRARRFFLPTLLLLVFGAGLVLASPSLDAAWIADDLHLIKHYTNQELAESFVASWDSSGTETSSYRPLTDVYYHVTYSLFGASLPLYRIFQVGLFAVLLAVFALNALVLGFSQGQVSAACFIILCTRNTWWQLVWPTDGVRLFMALFGSLALYCYLRYLQTARGWFAVAALGCYLVALLTREEILPYALLIPLVGWWHNQDRKQALKFGALLLGVSALFVGLRRIFVPDAVAALYLPGWPLQIGFVVLPRLFTWLPLSLAALLLFWGLVALAKPNRRAWFWLLCVALAATPGIVISRANNSLLPVTFFALFLVSVFAQKRALHIAVLTLYLSGSIVAHQDAQRALAPNSIDRVTQARRFLYGDWQNSLPWIPPERLEQLRSEAEKTDVIETPPIWSGW